MALSAISLPDTRVNLYELVKRDGYIESTSWDIIVPKPGGTDGEMQSRIGTTQTLINDIQGQCMNGFRKTKGPLIERSLDVKRCEKPRWPTDALYELRKFSLRGSPDRLRHSKKKRRRKLK